jgi:hypothetical protein
MTAAAIVLMTPSSFVRSTLGAACGLPLSCHTGAAAWPACGTWAAKPAVSTHAGTDVRPIARCLRYGKLAPINNDVIPATKRPNAIHLGCMVNLVGRPPHPHTVLLRLAQVGGYEPTANRKPHPGSWYSTRTLPWKMSQASRLFSPAYWRAPVSVSNSPWETPVDKSMR